MQRWVEMSLPTANELFLYEMQRWVEMSLPTAKMLGGKLDKENGIAKYFWRKSSLLHFPSAVKEGNLIQVTLFYFQLKFSLKKLKRLRYQYI